MSTHMAKRFSTLEKEYDSLLHKACCLVDARDAGDAAAVVELEEVRARRDAVKRELRARATDFDRWDARHS
jgi:hypothetical protein